MRSALAVVVVRDDGASNADRAEQAEARRPGRGITDLVDLVAGEAIGPQSNGGGARECQAAAHRHLLQEPVAHPVIPPVPQRVGWTAGSREDVVGLAEPGEKPLELPRRGPAAVPQRGEPDVAPDMLVKVGHDPGGELVRVLLEAEGRIEKDGVEPRIAYPRDQVLVDRRHHRTCLSGTENGDQSRQARVRSGHTENATSRRREEASARGGLLYATSEIRLLRRREPGSSSGSGKQFPSRSTSRWRLRPATRAPGSSVPGRRCGRCRGRAPPAAG